MLLLETGPSHCDIGAVHLIGLGSHNRKDCAIWKQRDSHLRNFSTVAGLFFVPPNTEEKEICICSRRLGLLKMDHLHSGMVDTVSNEPRNRS
jgi:hypothetical protein